MSEKSTFLEFVMGLANPTLNDEPANFYEVGENIWQVEKYLLFPGGLYLPCRMTAIRSEDGELLLHSPVSGSDKMWDKVEALGEVKAIVAPNSFHHVFVPKALKRFPNAELYAAPGLEERVSEFPDSTELTSEPPKQWENVVDLEIVGSDEPRYGEVVFFHKASRTLVLTDLAFNGPPSNSWWQYIGWRLFGVDPAFGPSRNIRLTLFRYIDSLSEQLARILEWDFDKITVAHGDVVETDAKETFIEAFESHLPKQIIADT